MGLVDRLTSGLRRRLESRPRFVTDDVVVGRGVEFGSDVVFNCRRVRIGDGVVFQDHIRVDAEHFEIGDYGTIYSYCFFPGPGTLRIGHNFWLGNGAIVDCNAGTTIGDNVGVGAHSQLWTHMAFGDVLAGCRFHARKPLVIENDVWFVGHCLVSPVEIRARSMALLGSVVTRKMEADRVYAGVPAKDVTEKFGPQFEATSLEQRLTRFTPRLAEFARRHGLGDHRQFAAIASSADEACGLAPNVTVFNVADRSYVKRGTPTERALMRFLLPDAKFIPTDSWRES